MLTGKVIRLTGVLTLFFFVFFIASADIVTAKQKEEDTLMKARKLYRQGDYEGSIDLLSKFIDKLRAMVEQKKNVAEAFYLLAKIYYEVGDDTKVDENLEKVFETYPGFTMEEPNFGFKERVEKVRQKFLALKEAEAEQMKQDLEAGEQEVQPGTQVIQQPAPSKKKKKKFPVLLVVGGAAVVAVLVLLLTKKKKDEYDIRGNWTVRAGLLGENYVFTLNFKGSLTSGTFVDNSGDTGTYTVTDKTVNFKYNDYAINFNGQFNSKDSMGGSWAVLGVSGTWSATRGLPPAAAQLVNFLSQFK